MKKGRRSNMKKNLQIVLLDISIKLSHLLFGAWSLLFVHLRFTPSEGPKGFKISLLRNPTMEV